MDGYVQGWCYFFSFLPMYTRRGHSQRNIPPKDSENGQSLGRSSKHSRNVSSPVSCASQMFSNPLTWHLKFLGQCRSPMAFLSLFSSSCLIRNPFGNAGRLGDCLSLPQKTSPGTGGHIMGRWGISPYGLSRNPQGGRSIMNEGMTGKGHSDQHPHPIEKLSIK